MKFGELSIGQLSSQTGCKTQTIRYYEQIGVLKAPARTHGNQRRYSQHQAGRLSFVRHSRELGFTLSEIRELLDLSDHPERPCAAADRIARRQLQNVRSRVARLNALKRELQRMIDRCRGGRIAECRVIEALADHAHCVSEHSNILPRSPR